MLSDREILLFQCLVIKAECEKKKRKINEFTEEWANKYGLAFRRAVTGKKIYY